MNSIVAAWCVTYLIHSTLLIAVVWLSARWIASPSVRDTLWKVALVGAIATSTLQLVLPLERTPATRVAITVAAQPEAPPAAPQPASLQASPIVTAPAVATPIEASAVRPRVTWTPSVELLYALWIAVACVLLARIGVGRNRFLARIGDRVEVVTGDSRVLLDRLCAFAGVRRVVRLSESSGVASPVAMLGWEIVVPAGVFSRLTDEQRETILAHEVGHLVRRDPLWLTIGEIVKATLFFQPLNWIVQSRMKETAEFLCDDAAVLQTGNGRALAETLAELASAAEPPVPVVAAMAEGGSNLIVRVTRVLKSRPALPLPLRIRVGMAAAVLLATAVVFPGIAPAVTPAKPADPERSPASASQMDVVAAAERRPVEAQVARTEPSRTAKPTAAPKTAAKTAQRGDEYNDFTHGVLDRTITTPNGSTDIVFRARNAQIAMDGSWVRFHDPAGFVRATETSERGPKREIEVTASRDGEPVYRYRVDGMPHAWCDDARRTMIAAFAGSKAYEDAAPVRTSKPGQWDASISLTGTADGVPTRIRIRVVAVAYDDTTDSIEFGPAGYIEVLEQHGDLERSFNMDSRQKLWRGGFAGEDPRVWLRRMMQKHTKAPAGLIRALTRE